MENYKLKDVLTRDEIASIKLFSTFIKNLRTKYNVNGELPLDIERLISGIHSDLNSINSYLEDANM
jgi:hypothetical protein